VLPENIDERERMKIGLHKKPGMAKYFPIDGALIV